MAEDKGGTAAKAKGPAAKKPAKPAGPPPKPYAAVVASAILWAILALLVLRAVKGPSRPVPAGGQGRQAAGAASGLSGDDGMGGVVETTPASPENEKTSEMVFGKTAHGVVIVESFDGAGNRVRQGSGVVVGWERIVTNRHVVERGQEIRVRQGKRSWPASVLFADRDYDLCALRVDGFPEAPLTVGASSSLRSGQRVYAVGSPHGLELSISDGLVSALRPYSATHLIQNTADISPGSSGGGLFDTEGRLVGITTFSEKGGQNLNFALPADLVVGMRDRSADIASLTPVAPAPEPAPPQASSDPSVRHLQESIMEKRRAAESAESALDGIEKEIASVSADLEERKKVMEGFRASGNLAAYNANVPEVNGKIAELSRLLARREELQKEYQQAVEETNRLVSEHNARGMGR